MHRAPAFKTIPHVNFRLLIAFGLIIASVAGLYSATPSTAAVVVCGPGHESGFRFTPGDSVVNPSGHEELFILDADCRLRVVPPGGRLRLPDSPPQAAPMFEESARALEEFSRRWASLHNLLLERYPDNLPPDTVESFMVYPLNAALLDYPEAFKWHGDSLDSHFSLYRYTEDEALYATASGQGLVKHGQMDSLIIQGERYRWEVRADGRAYSAWLRVLTDSELVDLGGMLETMDELERRNNPDKRVSHAWTRLKTALLAERELYYEARALIRGEWETDPERGPFYRELLRQVRYMQLFGDPLRPVP